LIELKKLWGRIEKQAIYVSLFLFFVLHLLAKFIPWISNQLVEKRGDVLLTAIVLLFVFRYIDGKLKTLDEQAFQISNSFLQKSTELLRERGVCVNLDVFAHTGQLYARAVLDSGVQIKNLRILIRDMRNLDKLPLPTCGRDKVRIQQELESTIQEWKQLEREGRIDNMCIRFYPFDPMMTFMVIDRNIAYFDLMKPQKALPGSTSRYTPTCYIVTDRTKVGFQLISDLSTEFEQIWNEFK
jgi:hypothetical protein